MGRRLASARRAALVLLAQLLIGMVIILGGILIFVALGITRGVWWMLGDRLTKEGTRLKLLSQRLDDALVRLEAALQFCAQR